MFYKCISFWEHPNLYFALQFPHNYNNIFNDWLYRHDIAEVAGLVGMSFGQEGVDRYIVVYKKENTPSEDEVRARREGDEWNADKAKEYAESVMIILYPFLRLEFIC